MKILNLILKILFIISDIIVFDINEEDKKWIFEIYNNFKLHIKRRYVKIQDFLYYHRTSIQITYIIIIFLALLSYLEFCTQKGYVCQKNIKIINDSRMINEFLKTNKDDWNFLGYSRSEKTYYLNYKKNKKTQIEVAENEEHYSPSVEIKIKSCCCDKKYRVSGMLYNEKLFFFNIAKELQKDKIDLEQINKKKLQQKNYEKLLVKKPIQLSE